MTDDNGIDPPQELVDMPGGTALAGLAGDQSGVLASPEELAAFQVRFLRLLERRTAIFTMGDSTSVPTHVAADLLRSIAFVLGIDPDEPQVTQQLLSADLADEYKWRLARIGERVAAAKKLWRDVCATMPLVDNIALRDTIKSLGEFFRWYDYGSMAHEIPVTIDYPLCHPVPESLLGIDYIEQYLRRLMIEAEFLSLFEQAAIERVLKATCADPVEDLVNVYGPVATNAIGRALAGKRPGGLQIAEKDRAEIVGTLAPRGPAARTKALRQATAAVCDALGISREDAREYLGALVPELLSRLAVGLERGGLRGVFVG